MPELRKLEIDALNFPAASPVNKVSIITRDADQLGHGVASHTDRIRLSSPHLIITSSTLANDRRIYRKMKLVMRDP
jgi:hypothetical protein